MADAFERMLAKALAPGERPLDRAFVARVQARIALDRQFASRRRAIVAALGEQIVALGALAAAIYWFLRAAPGASRLADAAVVTPALLPAGLGICVLLSVFAPRAGLAKLNGA